MIATKKEQIIDLICWELHLPQSQIFSYTSFTDDLNLDQVDTMLLIADLENRLNIFLTEDEVNSIETVGDASMAFVRDAA